MLHLVKELGADGELFQKDMRLTREQFAQVLHLVESDQLVKHFLSREAICPRQRLCPAHFQAKLARD